jgi:hypothetical protein
MYSELWAQLNTDTPISSFIGPNTLIYGPDVLFWGGVGAATGIYNSNGGEQ